MSSPEQNVRKRTLFVLASVLQGRHAKRRAAVQSLVDVIQSDEDNDDERSAAVVEHALDALYEASVLAAIPLLAAVGCLLCICDLVPATHALVGCTRVVGAPVYFRRRFRYLSTNGQTTRASS